MNTEEVKALYDKYVMPTYTPAMAIKKAKGSRVYDLDKNIQYYDMTSGISCHNVGHCTDGVVAAIAEQAAKLGLCSNLFMNDVTPRLAQKLVEISGLGGKVFFCNSGAEANEAAIKL
ncbi:MAG: aminotransferase class III-fold pyridoxal phosphate-dependent enzyme, partial [Kiritimatiellae bacterium]|nr:aminotransferase class III-fold pyridoxal phosphate-dependent enzyme [Kiritimatiellia bacterium]